jgi:hypothetical protein
MTYMALLNAEYQLTRYVIHDRTMLAVMVGNKYSHRNKASGWRREQCPVVVDNKYSRRNKAS